MFPNTASYHINSSEDYSHLQNQSLAQAQIQAVAHHQQSVALQQQPVGQTHMQPHQIMTHGLPMPQPHLQALSHPAAQSHAQSLGQPRYPTGYFTTVGHPAYEIQQATPEIPLQGDSRLMLFRKLPKVLKPSVLLKSWQRVCMLVAGIEASREFPAGTSNQILEKEIYDRYHGNLNRNPPLPGTVRRAMEDQIEMLATDKFGIKFPKDKISYAQMTNSLPGHNIWRYYKEVLSEVSFKINRTYLSCLNRDLSFPEGKELYDVIEDCLKLLWYQNESNRKEKATKKEPAAGGLSGGLIDGSDSEEDDTTSILLSDPSVLNKSGITQVPGNSKPFPGMGKFQPISFLSFLLMGPPAGEKCFSRFALVPSVDTTTLTNKNTNISHPTVAASDNSAEIANQATASSVSSAPSASRSDKKRPRSSAPFSDDESDYIRRFNAETAARAQRFEELKLAVSLFPNDEKILAEFKEFVVDSQRRTSLDNNAN